MRFFFFFDYMGHNSIQPEQMADHSQLPKSFHLKGNTIEVSEGQKCRSTTEEPKSESFTLEEGALHALYGVIKFHGIPSRLTDQYRLMRKCIKLLRGSKYLSVP